jgi:lipopolysaccharide transport system ATP-binding protein
MQAVSRLCDRAICLERGEMIDSGPAGEVVARYLQSVGGSGPTVIWPDQASAPGDGLVRLRSVRVVLDDHSTADAVDVRKPVGIEIAFVILREGVPVFPKIKVIDRQGDIAFNAIDTSPRWHEPTLPGEYVSTAWLPGNLLNEGFTTVDVDICALGPTKLISRASVREAVSFHVQDPAEGDSARGLYTGQWRGVVRPLLEWTTEER